ncbi:MAG: M36 family metallopeptidase [Actinobacteria bacterium]|nr:M36 family metallopeptidase [Actinomycetota bacterium]
MKLTRPVIALAGLLTVALAASVISTASAVDPVSAHLQRPLAGVDSGTFPGSEVPLGDRDDRGPRKAPLPGAVAAVAGFGGGVSVSWNQYGTPRTLTRPGGWLATGLAGSPVDVARSFLTSRSALLGLTAAEVSGLELVYDVPLQGNPARVVLLRQRAGDLPFAEDGLISIGVRGGSVASLTSSAVGSLRLNTTTPVLGAVPAVLAAAKDAGITTLGPGDLTLGALDAAGFQLVNAAGLAQPQRARLRALPTTASGLRLAWEVDVLDVAGGRALAAISFVDAVTGKVLLRRDAVDTAAAGTRSSAGMRSVALPTGQALPTVPSGGTLSGTYSATTCSARLPLTVPPGTQSITVAIGAVNTANDITFTVRRNGTSILDQDLLTSPEAGQATVQPPALATDAFTVEVCPFQNTGTAPFDFVGNYVTSDAAAGPGALPPLPNLPGNELQGPPTWRAFGSNPMLARAGTASPDNREKVCGAVRGATVAKDLSACDVFTFFDASPLPYDVDATTGLPTFATLGNNAQTSNAQASTSLTPGPPAVPFGSPTRDYAPPFTDVWNTSRCDPVQTLGGADVDASIVNLFVGHNLTHDFTYRLGLTEPTGALQVNNFGKGGAEGDPEVGNAQNAAATNPTFTATNPVTTPTSGLGLTGRNNANQITLQDGVAGITNQYLFEPVVGFAAPCVDGGLDATIFVHEYVHAVTNRLVAGPDAGLSGEQAGAMGESWSDLVSVEYLQAFDLAGERGEDPFSVGAYSTGDPEVGIRDYNLRPDKNPLNYSSYGFDTTGPEVHADGEIWNATQMTIREALVEAYRSRFDPEDSALQEACALGRNAAGAPASTFDGCPGNRRWVTYLFDAMLLQANASPTMVDMKDAMLAADMLRTNGVDQRTIADAYASRGLGAGSEAVDAADTDPTPSFASPTAARNAQVTFALVDDVTGKPVAGSVYVGNFQARATPVATTLGGDNPDATVPLIAGAYDLLVQAPGYGLQRFPATFAAGTSPTQTLRLLPNVASASQGATVSGDGIALVNVIDDDEATLGGFDGAGAGTPVAGRSLTVDLAGGLTRISSVAVSALHRPADPEVEGDFAGGRLLGVRAFDLEASSDGGRTFTTVYRSPEGFFPADKPRAVAPDLNLRTVTLPAPVVADTLRMVVRTNTCTGAPDFAGVEKAAAAEVLAPTDCRQTPNAQQVTITELQAFGAVTVAAPAVVPVAAGRVSLPATGAEIALAVFGVLLIGIAIVVARRMRS